MSIYRAHIITKTLFSPQQIEIPLKNLPFWVMTVKAAEVFSPLARNNQTPVTHLQTRYVCVSVREFFVSGFACVWGRVVVCACYGGGQLTPVHRLVVRAINHLGDRSDWCTHLSVFYSSLTEQTEHSVLPEDCLLLLWTLRKIKHAWTESGGERETISPLFIHAMPKHTTLIY